eukprot:9472145-Pyramimonas_sp.AAC.1
MRSSEPSEKPLTPRMPRSGVLSSRFAPRRAPNDDQFQIPHGTWNASALLHHNLDTREPKINDLDSHLRHNTGMFFRDLHRLSRPYTTFSTLCEKRNTGGEVIIILGAFAKSDKVRHRREALVQGRAQRFRISGVSSGATPPIVLYNIHNFARQLAHGLHRCPPARRPSYGRECAPDSHCPHDGRFKYLRCCAAPPSSIRDQQRPRLSPCPEAHGSTPAAAARPDAGAR